MMEGFENKSPKRYEHAVLDVYCPSTLVENSEELRAIFRCATLEHTRYCIRISASISAGCTSTRNGYSVLIQPTEDMQNFLSEKQRQELQLRQDPETLKEESEEEMFDLEPSQSPDTTKERMTIAPNAKERTTIAFTSPTMSEADKAPFSAPFRSTTLAVSNIVTAATRTCAM